MITVKSPLLPPLEEFVPMLREIWDRKWLTNNGDFHTLLEERLAEYLGVPYVSLFANGTLALVAALQAMRIGGEVITTPYSFVATTHALWWNGVRPVFVDVDPATGCIDPDKIEAAVTRDTTAILPVHVYGNPCNTDRIDAIAAKYGLKVLYDAAHAFGVKRNDRSILSAGDMSALSFHATKCFNTAEGGALVCKDEEAKERIDYLKNFGFAGETEVVYPGINGKLDEIRSAFGLVNLTHIDEVIGRCKENAGYYREHLSDLPGVRMFAEMPGVKYNYSYFPIFINESEYGMSRDNLYFSLRKEEIWGRRYFYPLISDFETYRHLPSAAPHLLPAAHQLSREVICIPMHHALSESDREKVVRVIRKYCRK